LWTFVILPIVWEIYSIMFANWKKNDYLLIGVPKEQNTKERQKLDRAKKLITKM